MSEEMACCVRGYQVYKDIWAAAIGEVFTPLLHCVNTKLLLLFYQQATEVSNRSLYFHSATMV